MLNISQKFNRWNPGMPTAVILGILVVIALVVAFCNPTQSQTTSSADPVFGSTFTEHGHGIYAMEEHLTARELAGALSHFLDQHPNLRVDKIIAGEQRVLNSGCDWLLICDSISAK